MKCSIEIHDNIPTRKSTLGARRLIRLLSAVLRNMYSGIAVYVFIVNSYGSYKIAF